MTGAAKRLAVLCRGFWRLPCGSAVGRWVSLSVSLRSGFSTGCLTERTAGAAAGLTSRTPLAAPACLCGVNTNVPDGGRDYVVGYCGTVLMEERKKHDISSAVKLVNPFENIFNCHLLLHRDHSHSVLGLCSCPDSLRLI